MSDEQGELARVIGALEDAQARGKVWGGDDDRHGEGWRHDRAPLKAAGYWLEVEPKGERARGRYVARVSRDADDKSFLIEDLISRGDGEGLLELEAQAVLLRALEVEAQELRARASSGWGGARAGAGRPAAGDEPRARGVSIRLTASEMTGLEAYAARAGLSRSRAAAKLIADALKLEGGKA